MSLTHKFKKYTYWKVNVRTMCGDVVYGINDYESGLSQAMTSASLEPHTYTPCIVCWTPEEIKQIDKARERFPRFKYKPTTEKENTMNTYTIYVNSVTDTAVHGTDAHTNDGRLNILSGDKLIAVFNTWEHYSVERDVDKGYVDKINELEEQLKNMRQSYTRVTAEVERNKTTITELRKQRNEFKSKLNSLYGRDYITARESQYLTPEARDRFVIEYNLLGYVDTDSVIIRCGEARELRWDGEPRLVKCRHERGHVGQHEDGLVAYKW